LGGHRLLKRTAGIAALLLSWTLLFFWLMIETELLFAPWDTAVTRPEIGTWQRTLNDFFETSPGNLTFVVLGVGASIALTLAAIRRGSSNLLRLAGINLLCFGVLLLVFTPVTLLNNAIFPYPPVLYDPTYYGYHRSVLPGGVMLAICAGWLLWQRRVALSR
jgi:hypothetical protein